ncbi:hypothetical protein FBU30_010628 [Linnemannia zychae]|nr:hypothetical protein FBU30_010628 [Linnemannia zychae]
MTIASPSQPQKVIIIGGGISGLSAAREISKDSNIQVTLLEARNRLGGRIATVHDLVPKSLELSGKVPPGASDLVYDFGASWIHGVDPTNPLYEIAQQGDMKYVHTDSDLMFKQPGPIPMPQEESNHLWQVVWDILDKAHDFARGHRDQIPENQSLREWLMRYLETTVQSHDPNGENYVEEEIKKWVPALSMYYADENAIPLEQVSMRWMDCEDIFPGDHSIVINGFDRAVKIVSSGIRKENARILLEHVVEKVEYDEYGVRVSTSQGLFTADKVICTLPLGVLKSLPTHFFSPALPAPKQLAISRLGFGTMYKILLFFPTCFWPLDKHFINFLPSALTAPSPALIQHFALNDQQVEALNVYMQDLANVSSLMPQYNIPILVGYATNRSAELMERLTDEQARMVYICQLAHYYPILLQEEGTGENGQLMGEALWPKVSFMSRWNLDPFARGSYTSIPVGASQKDIEAFDIPVAAIRALDSHSENQENHTQQPQLKAVDDRVNGRIFFAGEHTSPTRFASVHGALLTGQREANKILGEHGF